MLENSTTASRRKIELVVIYIYIIDITGINIIIIFGGILLARRGPVVE